VLFSDHIEHQRTRPSCSAARVSVSRHSSVPASEPAYPVPASYWRLTRRSTGLRGVPQNTPLVAVRKQTDPGQSRAN
jgi:hypothetical protein